VVQFRHTCETVHSTVRYGTVTRAVICDSARAGLGPKLSHIYTIVQFRLSKI